MNGKTDNQTKTQSQVQNMNFPRYIFAIGGAGKNIMYTILEKEWLLREILRPKFSATTVDITIIDTATEEKNNDKEKIREIEDNIRRLEEEYRNNPQSEDRNVGRINIFYRLLTEEMVLRSPYDLIGIGDKVKEATGASVWWVNDPILGEDWPKKVMTKENLKELNFLKGVYRKRAIGKAIYYKAISEGLFNLNINSSDLVSIVIGLGGGTGSGIAFDLATKLKSIQPTADITLFGILSTLAESPDEKANCFAMISEIEHGSLSGKSPFKDVILIPMEVTNYTGGERASDKRLLKEFDETIPYILTSYYNTPQLLFSNKPDYAPFIIAVPQMVRYNVESIKRLKDRVVEALNSKDISIKDEEHIYNTIKKFIEESYPELQGIVTGTGLSEEDKLFIRERFSKFNMVLGHELFKELNYNSVVILKKVVEDGIRGTDDIEKQISSIKSDIDMASVGSEGYKEETDKILYNILKRDIEIIETMKNVLNLTNSIQDDLVRDTLKTIIKVDEDRSRNRLNKIREKTGELSGKKKQLDGDVKSLEGEMKNYEEKIRKQIEENAGEWKQNEIKNIEHLNLIDERVPTLKNNLTVLKNELVEFVSRISGLNNTSAIDNESTRSIDDIAEKMNQELEKIGTYYEDRSLITRNLINLKEFRKSQVESKKSVPFLDKLLRTNRVVKTKEAKNRIMLKSAELNNDKVFGVRGNSISSIYEYDLEGKINGKKDEIISGIINRTKNKFQDAMPPLFSGLKEALNDAEKRKYVNIKEIIQSDLGYEIDINKIENQLKDRRTEIIKISRDIDILKTLETTMTIKIKDAFNRHSNHLKIYHDTITNIGRDVQAMREIKKDEIRYIMDMQPTNIYRATITGANINNVLEDRGEKLVLRQSLRDAIDRAVDVRYNVLVQRTIENKAHTKRWDRYVILNTFVTIADINVDNVDGRDIITKAFAVNQTNLNEFKFTWGDTWGVGLVLFVIGSPLDNIRNIIDPSFGYYRHYRQIEQNSAIFLHHSYMLEEGKFLKRKNMFNFVNDKDIEFLCQNDKTVIKAFSENYQDNTLVDTYKNKEINVEQNNKEINVEQNNKEINVEQNNKEINVEQNNKEINVEQNNKEINVEQNNKEIIEKMEN